jgi:predicted membrane channel-forming protein YqfA (hemolysin III family)
MAVARSGPTWRLIFLALLVGTSATYYRYATTQFPHGGSRHGLAYGIAGTALILLLAFFGIRKRWYRSTFGTLEQWLQSHIYLGVLVLIVLLFHTGGRFHDKIAVTTLVLVAIVVASGVVGAVLYITVPRMLTEVESNLTVDDINDQLNQLSRTMARIASGRSAPFQRIYEEVMRQTRPKALAGWLVMFVRLKRRRDQKAFDDWAGLLALVPKEEQEELRQMLVVSRQHKELLLRLVYQQRYKNVLEFWLYVHIPFTIALLAFAVLHVAAVFYYGRVAW